MMSQVTTPPASVMNRRGRWRARLSLSAAIVIFLFADIVAAGTLAIRAALPQTSGTIHASGAHAVITVRRDAYGVPHIFASDQHDAFFAQGYVTAQDRLWQMEFNRRVAAGRLSEVLGSATLDADRFLRTMGLARSAETDVTNLPVDLHGELDAYSEGVNAFISTHRDSLPLEFKLLGFTPEPWKDTDSIAYGKVVALDLDSSWSIKLARAAVIAKAGTEVAQQLFPAYPDDNPTLTDATGAAAIPLNSEGEKVAEVTDAFAAITPAEHAAFANLPVANGAAMAWLSDLFGGPSEPKGSNDWVVAGSHTTTGMPLLANDPHLGINYPSIWYEVAISGGAYNAIGFSFPGVPGIIIGHNAQIAWGVTNGMVDDTDLYLETMASDRSTYQSDGKTLSTDERDEVIKVSGKPDVTLKVFVTRHGPIINDVVDDLKDVTTPIALQWTALQPTYSFAGFFEVGAAHDWASFTKSVSHISISQNFVYADTSGNIGYHLSGWLPTRPLKNGLVPVDGSTSANDWTGQVPFDAMPNLYNPPTGIIWTANNRLAAPGYPYFITNDYDVGFRAKRIEHMLSEKSTLSADDIAHIQSDTHSIAAQEIAPFYLSAAQGGTSDGAKAAQQLFAGWDGDMTRESAAAALYEVTSSMLIGDMVGPVLGDKVRGQWQANVDGGTRFLFLRETLTTPTAPFLSSTSARDQAIVKAEDEAFDYLKAKFGTSDLSTWHWGDMHLAHFDHPLADGLDVGPVHVLRLLLPNEAVKRPGDSTTVNVGGAGGFTSGNYDQRSLPSMREIIDLGHLDDSQFVTTTGESGVPFDAHRLDLLPLWDEGRYQPMAFTEAKVKTMTSDTLTIMP